MITLTTALQILTEKVEPLVPQALAPTASLGRRLAYAAKAESDWPSTDVSTMDGYAARAADLAAGTPLPQAFEIPAGVVPEALPTGRCARIYTGAPLPAGADVVVPQEEVERIDDAIRMPRSEAGRFVRRRGEVIRKGDNLAEVGTLVTPQLLGLLAAVGPQNVRVFPMPRVAVLTTGAELLPPDAPLEPGQIRDSNGPMLAALASVDDLPVVAVERVADDAGMIERSIATLAAKSDLLLTNGGVSVGDYDLIPDVLQRLGAEPLFHRVATRPGRPVLAARLGNTWVLGLPGNPASAFVGWHLYGRRIAARLAGVDNAFRLFTMPATLDEAAANTGKRLAICPATLELRAETWHARVLPWAGSHDLLAVAGANAFVIIESGMEYPAGATVNCMPLEFAAA